MDELEAELKEAEKRRDEAVQQVNSLAQAHGAAMQELIRRDGVVIYLKEKKDKAEEKEQK